MYGEFLEKSRWKDICSRSTHIGRKGGKVDGSVKNKIERKWNRRRSIETISSTDRNLVSVQIFYFNVILNS